MLSNTTVVEETSLNLLLKCSAISISTTKPSTFETEAGFF